MLGLQPQRLVERAGRQDVHGRNCTVLVQWTLTLSRRLAVARGDEPADLVVRGGGCSRSSRANGSTPTSRSPTASSPGSATYEGRETLDATGRWVVPGFIDAHMHLESSKLLVDEFARLVLPFGTTAVVADPHEIANVLGTDGVHWLLDATAGLPLDVYFMASSCVPASQFESPRRALTPGDLDVAAPPPARDRPRRDDELPRRHRGRAVGAREARARAARRRPRARRARPRAQRVRGRRDPLRPRGVHRRGGPRAAARRHVAADPRGARPRATCRRCCRCSPSTARAASRSAPTTASPSTSPTTATSTRWFATRSPSASRPRMRSSARRSARRSGTASSSSARSRPATAPTCSSCPTSRRFVPELVLKARPPGRRDPARDVPDWVRHTVRIGAFGPEMFRIPWNGGDGARDRHRARPDRHRLARRRADAARRRGARRPRARPREDRRRRAAPRHRPRRPRLRARLRPAARRDRIDGRARRAQRRRRRHERRVDGGGGAPAREPRRRHRRRRRRRGARRAAAAGRGAALRRAARRGRRAHRARSSRRPARSAARSRRRSSTSRSSPCA